MIRDAFRQQGPFVGSGGPYNPGPATRLPLLTICEPLDGNSRATLGLLPVPSLARAASPTHDSLSPGTLADGFTRRPSLQARPLFTRP